MASTVLASRNQSFMGEIPNYSNNNPRHLNPNLNPNPNPNQKPKSNKKKHLPNGRLHSHNSHAAVDSSVVVVTQAASDDAYSYNQRPIDTGNGFNHGGYVTYNVAGCSRSEINELRKKLVSDLERIRNLNDRIQAGDLNPRSSNGKFKKLSGNKRQPTPLPFGSSNKDPKFRQGFVNGNGNGNGGGEVVVVFDDGLVKMCKQVLTKLMKHKSSWVFNKPVDAVALGLHDYHQIVKRPMDLGTVKSNLSKGFYSSPVEFESDVRLVFENAMLYNPRTDEVHKMADQLLMNFEHLFRPVQAKIQTQQHHHLHNVNHQVIPPQVNHVSHHVNEFSAVDELDGSSWDDIQTPDRSKKMKTSAPVLQQPSVSNKQNHSTASNPIIPPVRTRTPSPIQPVQTRTPSPMQAVEPVKPSSTATMTTATRIFPKLPKPRAKDPNKREMNMEEKQKLGLGLQSMPPEKMPQLLQIIRKRNDQVAQEGDEIELDIEALDTETLWELDRFVTNWKKAVSKTKRQALMVHGNTALAAPSGSADIDDVPMNDKFDGMKKNKKEAGEEDVDIGDEMPESSFPHVEIEKDDGLGQGVGGGQATGGHGNDNAASSSSSGSSSSSSGSSSSSDSDSGSSSGSDSDADDAQS